MNKIFSVFLATVASGAATIALAVFLFSPLRAAAYAVGPAVPSAPTGSYDLGSSLGNLISPFSNFFNNIKNTNGTVSIGGGSVNGAPSGVTISVNTQPYINQFDSWFYGFTGVHIEGFTNAAVHFFQWSFTTADAVVVWIAGTLKGTVK